MTRDVEVIVLGAGAAGAAAAFHLSHAGRRVLLLERQSWPRPKACGGGMAASVQRWFPFDLSPAVDRVIRRVRFTWNLEDPVTAELPGEAPFWIVRRQRLDQYLVEQAVAAGCSLESRWSASDVSRHDSLWQVRSDDGRLVRANALVIADGSTSAFSAPLGLGPARPRFATTLAAEVDRTTQTPAGEASAHDDDTAHFEFGLVHHGFCWAFPRQGGMSLGVGTFIGRDPADHAAVLERMLPSLGYAATAGERRGAPLRVWDGHHRLHGDGVIAVGDAASLCDPFLAEGLRPALMSGSSGAACLERWLAGDTKALGAYTSQMRADWGESMAWGRRIAQVFYRFPRVGYQLGIKRPTAPQRIAQILSGSMGYGDIAQRVIRRLLLQQG
ncbi:geranylgeranyl reductase family protein [Synechococcus sp. CBW1002]|uniref:geranylgeranyl reductase family protein n=1 Tax=Synechococcus sp. CBW1002 TaxID=1353134 RepID=UPI0018CEC130|nr:geranylgeranyl reductase family protein [Synechococcus sp. CBW1002]QPN59997.1 geranylgeranyl reductase family protein [Synechococcus sp. CBW1002]